MKITVSDDRPPLAPILLVGLIAGLVAVGTAGVLAAAGLPPSGLRTLLGIGVGLLVGLLLKGRFVRRYEAWRDGPDESPDEGSEAGEESDAPA